jgi:hypothetical protein
VRDTANYVWAPLLTTSSAAAPLPPPPQSPHPQTVLEKMISATYSRYPNMPHGLEVPYAGLITQKSSTGTSTSSVVISGGFCGGYDPLRKPAGGVYTRGALLLFDRISLEDAIGSYDYWLETAMRV